MTYMQAKPLLDFIAKPESGGDYNIVYGGIKKKDHPPKPLTKMTVEQVLAWQDSIDRYYPSEASGKYQIMEDTLRTLYVAAGVKKTDLFNERTQDMLAYELLRRRGWERYIDGRMSETAFANSLAKEWASLPVVTGAKKGRSYYGGDGLNKSHVSVDAFLQAVREAKTQPAVPAIQPATGLAGLFTAIVKILSSIFGAKK